MLRWSSSGIIATTARVMFFLDAVTKATFVVCQLFGVDCIVDFEIEIHHTIHCFGCLARGIVFVAMAYVCVCALQWLPAVPWQALRGCIYGEPWQAVWAGGNFKDPLKLPPAYAQICKVVVMCVVVSYIDTRKKTAYAVKNHRDWNGGWGSRKIFAGSITNDLMIYIYIYIV